MKHTVCLLLVVLGLSACSSQPTEKLSLPPADFEQQSQSTPGAVLLDVRTPEEVQNGYIKGAINMDFQRPEFKLLIAGLDKEKPYFVYCKSGMRSGKAADLMRDGGFENVKTLEGGLNAWRSAGLSTVEPKPTEP